MSKQLLKKKVQISSLSHVFTATGHHQVDTH